MPSAIRIYQNYNKHQLNSIPVMLVIVIVIQAESQRLGGGSIFKVENKSFPSMKWVDIYK